MKFFLCDNLFPLGSPGLINFCYNVMLTAYLHMVEESRHLQQNQFFPGRPTFRQASIREHPWTTRSFEDYTNFLFPDEGYRPKKYRGVRKLGFQYFGPSISDFDPVPTAPPLEDGIREVFTGVEGFFSPDAVILDLGSGSGKATNGIAERFKLRGVEIIGLDIEYRSDRPFEGEGEFVAGSWESLPFKDDTFIRVLGCETFPRHMWPHDRPNMNKRNINTFSEITRVAKKGAIWRSTHIAESPQKVLIISTMISYGWEIYFHPLLMIARLTKKS